MSKTIKTKEVIKDIKIHDSAVNVGGRIKDIGVKTKKKVSENISQSDVCTPEQFASDKITDTAKTVAEDVGYESERVVNKALNKGTEKVKEKIQKRNAEKRATKEQEPENTDISNEPLNENPEKSNNTDKTELKTDKKEIQSKLSSKSEAQNSKAETKSTTTVESKVQRVENTKSGKADEPKSQTFDKSKLKEVDESKPKPSEKPKQIFPDESKIPTADNPKITSKTEQAKSKINEKKLPRQRKQTLPKEKEKDTIKKVNDNKSVRTIKAEQRQIKQTKRSAEKSTKRIKKADNSVKTAEKTAKATKEAAKKSVETAKKTKEIAVKTAKATEKAVKVTAKAIVEAGKAVVAGVKELGALIAAGGIPAVVAIIIICLIGAIGGTCFGIFLSNDKTTGTQKTMSAAISELTAEHYENLTAMKASYAHDVFEVSGNTSINWKETLAVYAIKTTSGDNPLEVVTIDDTKMNLLRSIMKDMNPMTGVVTPRVVAENVVTTDANGKQTVTVQYVTKKVLTVTIAQLNSEQIATLYKFNEQQKAQLNELLSSEYDSLWNDLIGSGGQIIPSGSSFVGTDIFSWPFEATQNITSRFGYRTDPISGETKLHGGTDIAAPLGTPILAAADGVVEIATWHNSYGYYVKIKHNNTYSTLYGHCSALLVSAGQQVKKGQVIANCGSTGYSTGPHCHFEIIQNGVRVDAMRFFK